MEADPGAHVGPPVSPASSSHSVPIHRRRVRCRLHKTGRSRLLKAPSASASSASRLHPNTPSPNTTASIMNHAPHLQSDAVPSNHPWDFGHCIETQASVNSCRPHLYTDRNFGVTRIAVLALRLVGHPGAMRVPSEYARQNMQMQDNWCCIGSCPRSGAGFDA